jgi:hypothetical protein
MKFLRFQLLIAALIVFAASSAFASYSVDFTINSSTFSGPGYLDLQYGSGLGPASTAQVSNFSADATFGFAGAPILTGDVSGTLPGTVTINNTTGYNDYFHQVTFGNNLQFHVVLDGVAGNTFTLALLGSDGSTSLVTSDANGFATTIDVKAAGITINNNAGGQITATDVTPTPIPAAAWLFGSGLMGLVGIRRRKAA